MRWTSRSDHLVRSILPCWCRPRPVGACCSLLEPTVFFLHWPPRCTIHRFLKNSHPERRQLLAVFVDTPPFLDNIRHPVGSMLCTVFCLFRADNTERRSPVAAAFMDTIFAPSVDHGDFDLASSQEIQALQYYTAQYTGCLSISRKVSPVSPVKYTCSFSLNQ